MNFGNIDVLSGEDANIFLDTGDEGGNGQEAAQENASEENNDDSISAEDDNEEVEAGFNPFSDDDDDEHQDDDDGDNDDDDDEEKNQTKKQKKSPEGVGSEDKLQGKGKGSSSVESNPLIFSSFAKALKERGVFQDLEDEDIEKVQSGNDLTDLVDKVVTSRLDARQRRIEEALNNHVEPSLIKQYEDTIAGLDSITEEQIEAEGAEGEKLRKNILFRDYINKDFSKERAERAVKRAIEDGTDIEDAKDALESIKRTYKAKYDSILEEARSQEETENKARVEQAKELRKSILEDEKVFGDLEVNKTMRQKALDAVITPVYQDPETGYKYSAVQLYAKDHTVDFLRKVGLVYAMTDGFKNLDGLIKDKVKKGVSKGMRDLENALNGTKRNTDGSINFAAGTSADDPNSIFGITLDTSGFA